jgi:hypothetical protein
MEEFDEGGRFRKIVSFYPSIRVYIQIIPWNRWVGFWYPRPIRRYIFSLTGLVLKGGVYKVI